MVTRIVRVLLLFMLLATPAYAEDKPDPHATAMFAAIKSGNPQEAIEKADFLIARFESQFRNKDKLYFCGQSMTETLANMLKAAQDKKSGFAVSTDWCDAHFVKGFALIDLNRGDLAEQELRTATEMAPFNSHYLNEYAELFKSKREWQKSYDLFAEANGYSEFYPENGRKQVKARSLRGMGFTKIELKDLNEAKRLFQQSLEFEPNHQGAKGELEYIARKQATGQ